jgi:putative phosphoribosyl transferase
MSDPRPRPVERAVAIAADTVTLPGDLTVPERASGLVLFAHGSGSSRRSPRNRSVAQVLHAAGIGTLLFDLLTEREAEDRRNVFDILLLAERLLAATDWTRATPELERLPLGYFGASTGAAAALAAEARGANPIAAVVSRGGRPDLAAEWLGRVRAPTLLIVGELDEPVLSLNRQAYARLTCPKELVVVPGATHLFEEPGTLEQVAEIAKTWFVRHFGATP